MNMILHSHQLLQERTYLPALILILFMPKNFSLEGVFDQISFLLCMLLIDRVLNFQENQINDRKLFDGGFISGLSILFNPFSLGIFTLPIAGMVYFARLKLRQVMVYLTALAVPVILLLEVNYLFDLNVLFDQWQEPSINLDAFFVGSAYLSTIGLALIIILGFVAFFRSMAKNKVSIRSGVRLVLLFSLVGFSMMLKGNFAYESTFLFLGLPFSWYATNYFLNFRKKILANLTFFLLFIFFVYRDYADYWF